MNRFGIVAAIAAGVFASTAAAQLEQVVVDLTGVQLRNGLNQSRNSAPDTIAPAFGYTYEVDALVQGSGIIFGGLFPNPTPIAEVLEALAPGSSDFLTGTLYEPSGAHPIEFANERFQGGTNLLGIEVTFDVTLRIGIDAGGLVGFSFTDVVLSPSFLVGSATLTEGTLTATRVPAVTGDLNWDGEVNAFDIEPFLIALFDTQTYLETYGWDPIFPGDCNRDGTFDAFDIESFLDILFP